MRAKNNTAVRCAPVVVDFVVVAGSNSRGSRRRAIILAVAIHKSTGSEREPQNVNTTQLRTVQCQCALQLSRYFAANNDLLLTLFQIVSFIGNIIDCRDRESESVFYPAKNNKLILLPASSE